MIISRLNSIDEHVKNYAPQILALTGPPGARPALLQLANLITKNHSLLISGEVYSVVTIQFYAYYFYRRLCAKVSKFVILDTTFVSVTLGAFKERLFLASSTTYKIVLSCGGGFKSGTRRGCVDAGHWGRQISPQRGPHGLQDSLVDMQLQRSAGILQHSSVRLCYIAYFKIIPKLRAENELLMFENLTHVFPLF